MTTLEKTVSTETLLGALEWRYATKVFDASRTIPDEIWADLEKSLVLTPSSFGLQPWKFLVLTDRAQREELVPLSWHQRQVADSSHLVLFLARRALQTEDIEKFVQLTADVRGQERESLEGYFGVMERFRARLSSEELSNWAQKQCYIAQGQLMLATALAGVDSCPMEGFEREKVDAWVAQKFGLGDYTTALMLPCGYRDDSDKYANAAKVRYPLEEVVVRG